MVLSTGIFNHAASPRSLVAKVLEFMVLLLVTPEYHLVAADARCFPPFVAECVWQAEAWRCL